MPKSVKESNSSKRQHDRRHRRLITSLDEHLANIPDWPRHEMQDENYLDETQRIQAQLQDLLQGDEQVVLAFLRVFPRITPLNAEKARLWAAAATNPTTQQGLANYIAYACRFLVYAKPRREKVVGKSGYVVEFRALERPTCNMLAARIGKHVVPDVVGLIDKDEEWWPYFNAPNLHLPTDVQRTLRESNARIVHLRDESSNNEVPTVLHELETWFYDPDSLTFLIHGSNPPKVLCLIGENIDKQPWRDTDKFITALQREYLNRKQGGRKKDRKQLSAAEEQALLPGPQKDKLSSLGYYGAQSSQQSSLSRARRESRKRKKP